MRIVGGLGMRAVVVEEGKIERVRWAMRPVVSLGNVSVGEFFDEKTLLDGLATDHPIPTLIIPKEIQAHYLCAALWDSDSTSASRIKLGVFVFCGALILVTPLSKQSTQALPGGGCHIRAVSLIALPIS